MTDSDQTMSEHPEIDELNRRLKPLFRYLRPGDGSCPFVIDAHAAKRVALSHQSAGRDATLVQLGRKWDGKFPLDDLAVTIRYAPFVEGTAIIYDVIDETMQGKARPFDCDLKHRFARMYMLLPYQIERAFLEVKGQGEGRTIEIAFLDARDEIIQAALPFQWSASHSCGRLLASNYAATNRVGQFRTELPMQAHRVTIHCCLTGGDETLTV